MCRACGANIFWAKSKLNKGIPMNLEPTLDGNVLLEEHEGEPPRAYVFSAGQARKAKVTGTKLYLSHFATCPAAAEFRKKKESAVNPKTPPLSPESATSDDGAPGLMDHVEEHENVARVQERKFY